MKSAFSSSANKDKESKIFVLRSQSYSKRNSRKYWQLLKDFTQRLHPICAGTQCPALLVLMHYFNGAKLIDKRVKAAWLMWRGHKRGLNKWCGRGQVWASVKTSHLFVAATGQQVSTQLKISAQGRRPAPAAAGAQMKMFWRTLSVHTSPFLKQYLATMLSFFLLFFWKNGLLAGSCDQYWWIMGKDGKVSQSQSCHAGRYESKSLDFECRLHSVSFT